MVIDAFTAAVDETVPHVSLIMQFDVAGLPVVPSRWPRVSASAPAVIVPAVSPSGPLIPKQPIINSLAWAKVGEFPEFAVTLEPVVEAVWSKAESNN
jgi:hypothetical protein